MRNKTPEYRLKKLIKLCQGTGIKRVVIEGVEIEFYPGDAPTQIIHTAELPSDPQPTSEEMLFWSAGGVEEPSEDK